MPTDEQIHERKTYTKPRKRLKARQDAFDRLKAEEQKSGTRPGSLKK